MSNFAVSPKLLNIFYADAFMHNNLGYLVMGTGKSNFSSLSKSSGEVIEDFCCLSRVDNKLYAHNEPYIINKNYSPTIKIEINTFIFCLSDVETINIFGTMPREILLSDYKNFFQAAKFNICFTIDPLSKIKDNTTLEVYKKFVDFDSRGINFMELTMNIANSKFLVLPWMDSVEEKSNLFKSFT